MVNLLELYRSLEQKIAKLETKIERLERENESLKAENKTLKIENAELKEKLGLNSKNSLCDKPYIHQVDLPKIESYVMEYQLTGRCYTRHI